MCDVTIAEEEEEGGGEGGRVCNQLYLRSAHHIHRVAFQNVEELCGKGIISEPPWMCIHGGIYV